MMNHLNSQQWIKLICEGGNVERFHTFHLNKRQDVAQHSFNCALIIEELCHHIEGVDAHSCVMHMLLHDVPEQAIGDTPSYAKYAGLKEALDKVEYAWCQDNMQERHVHTMYDLNYKEHLLCRFVDQYEAYLKSLEECNIGNRRFEKITEIIHNKMTNLIASKNCNVDEEYIFTNTERLYLYGVIGIYVS